MPKKPLKKLATNELEENIEEVKQNTRVEIEALREKNKMMAKQKKKNVQ